MSDFGLLCHSAVIRDRKRLALIREMKLDGYSYLQIAKTIGLSRQGIQHYLKIKGTDTKRRCEICHRPSSVLHCHHIDYRDDVFLRICPSCHTAQHGKTPPIVPISTIIFAYKRMHRQLARKLTKLKINNMKPGEKRRTVNIRTELHLRMKRRAINESTTVEKLYDAAVRNFLKPVRVEGNDK